MPMDNDPRISSYGHTVATSVGLLVTNFGRVSGSTAVEPLVVTESKLPDIWLGLGHWICILSFWELLSMDCSYIKCDLYKSKGRMIGKVSRLSNF